MTDECKNCSVRGDLKKCMETKCGIHESWFVNALLKKIEKLEIERERKA